MESLRLSPIHHFSHPKHPLTLSFASNTTYLCDGCKIPGIGERYRCSQCNFDLHKYCGTSPINLSSSLHPQHSLNLLIRKPPGERRLPRFCNVCLDSPEGLFYRCEACDFDVHPLCTQLPQTLRHVLHEQHPLRLLRSDELGTCAVCRGECDASWWRYRCPLCGVDIHIDCVPIQCEKNVTTDRGIPTYVSPSRFTGYANETPTYAPPPTFPHFGGYNPNPNHFPGPSNNMYYYNNSYSSPSYMHNSYMPPPQHQNHGQAHTHYGGGRIGQVMFKLVQTLGIGAFSNMIFGMDSSSTFNG